MKRPSPASLRSKFFLASLAALTAGMFLGGSPARATTYSWTSATGTGTTDFNTASNWSPSGVPGGTAGSPSTTDLATFGDPTGLNTTVNIAAVPLPFATISFNTATSSGYNLTSSSPSIGYTLNGATAISGSFAGGTDTISAPITLTAATAAFNLSATSASANVLNVSGVLSGVSNVAVSGAKATINFGPANTYTGTTTIGNVGGSGTTLTATILNNVGSTAASSLGEPATVAAGTVQLGSNSASGTLQYLGTGSTTDRRISLGATTGISAVDASGSGALVITGTAGTNDVIAGTTAVASHTLTLTGSYGTATTSNVFGEKVTDLNTAATNVTKSGTGTWTLSGANTYTGATSIQGGTLVVGGTSATGTSAVGFSGAGGTLASTAGSVTLTSAVTTTSKTTSTISPGGTGTVGMLTLNSLNASTGSTFAFDLGATSGGTSSDSLNVANAFTASATTTGTLATGSLVFNLTNAGATPGTTYTLVTFGSQTGLDTGDLTATGVAGTFSVTGTGINFTVAAVPEPSTWVGALFVSVLGALGLRRRLRSRCA